MKKIHFHSLDALRFFAFLKVYLLHVPLQGNFPIFSYLKSGGGIGVAFFFVLSGFLITYLLVYEKIHQGRISIKSFLIRRSLRIWPLFYLMVILACVLPLAFKEYWGLHMVGGGYDFDWKYSFSFLENYKMLMEDNFPKTTPLPVFWSLCIEEHFYIVWLIGLFFIPVKHIFKFLIFSIFVSFGARILEGQFFNNTLIVNNDLFTHLDFFACGGILGYLTANNYAALSKFINGIKTWIKYTLILLIVSIVVFQADVLPYDNASYFNVIRPTIIALLFTILVALFVPIDSTIKIKSRILSYLGSISFGLYVYHIIVVHCVFQYYIRNNILIDDLQTLMVFIGLTLGGTILISSISYRYFEKPFLVLRNRWTKKE